MTVTTTAPTTSLPTTRLGWTGMHLTRVGFGAWAIGGGDWAYAWGGQDDAASIAAIRHAVESGVNWIDTAAVYGLGHSEEVVAAALTGIPEADRLYVFTKGGLVWDPADRSFAPRRVGNPASLRAEVEASLRRLRVERIDLYQMHWPAEDGVPVEEYWQVFTDLKRQGKIRAAGLSNHDICQLEAAENVGNVDAIQPPFNLIHRDAADDVFRWAREHESGVIVYSPMASGLLTGAFSAERVLFQVTGQQLSVLATRRILARIEALFGGRLPAPAELLEIDPGKLREAGLSWRKVSTLRDLAERFSDGRLNEAVLSALPDEELMAELTAVPGIGPWTVQGALLIALQREDVVLPGDLALRKAVQAAYRLDRLPSQQEVLSIAEKWRPHRSLATSYLFSAAFEPAGAPLVAPREA